MPRFQILPVDQSQSAEIIASNAANVLPVVHRLECQAADVLCDGEYRFSVQLGRTGVWTIYQREHEPDTTVRVMEFA